MEEKNIEADFSHLLKKARRQMTACLLRESFRDSWYGASVLLVLGAVVWFFLSFSYDGFVSLSHVIELLLLPPLVASLAITVFQWRRRYPKLTEVAERLDLKAGSRNVIATAWELVQEPQTDSPFKRLAIEQGHAVLQFHFSDGVAVDENARRHTWLSINFLLASILVLLPLGLVGRKLSGARNAVALSEIVAAGAVQPGVALTECRSDATTRPGSVIPAGGAVEATAVYQQSNRSEAAEASGADAGQQASGASQQSGSSGNGNAAANPKRTAAERKNQENRKARQSASRSPQQSQSGSQGDSASGNSGMKNSQSGVALQNLSLSGNADNHNAGEEEDQADNQGKPSIYSSRGGVKPLPADNGVKPGRELGKDQKGDKPSEGRGGPTGEKKSRGTASLIAGVSLPDVVVGKLSKGFDITNLEHIPALREPAESVVFPPPQVAAVEEPVVHPVEISPELRTPVKNYLLKLHQYDNQQQEKKYGTDNVSNP